MVALEAVDVEARRVEAVQTKEIEKSIGFSNMWAFEAAGEVDSTFLFSSRQTSRLVRPMFVGGFWWLVGWLAGG